MNTIGLIGAGHIGSQLARLAVKNDYDVVISNSRGPETLADLVRELGPHARAATPEEAARAGDIVVVTIPLKKLGDVPVAPLAGKIVIDTLNYYPQRDGRIAELDSEKTTTSEMVQRHLPGSKVVVGGGPALETLKAAYPKALFTGAWLMRSAVMSCMRKNQGVRPSSSVMAMRPSFAYSAAPKRLRGPSFPAGRSRSPGMPSTTFV